jgi:hypothetical protein
MTPQGQEPAYSLLQNKEGHIPQQNSALSYPHGHCMSTLQNMEITAVSRTKYYNWPKNIQVNGLLEERNKL